MHARSGGRGWAEMVDRLRAYLPQSGRFDGGSIRHGAGSLTTNHDIVVLIDRSYEIDSKQQGILPRGTPIRRPVGRMTALGHQPFPAAPWPPIDAATRVCAVYGYPVRHSASPPMQNAGLAALGLNWRYLAFEVPPHHLQAALAGAKAMRFAGLNLTVPHKILAVEMMDLLDESARTWGAVNTVRFEGRDPNGVWRPLPELAAAPTEVRSHGFNTDADAIATAIREDLAMELAGATVLLLGAGGAGRTAALKLASEKVAGLFLVNRTFAKAEALAGEVRQRFPGISAAAGYPSGRVDLVLNATSLGLKPGDPPPFDEGQFSLRQAGAVFDMIYRPAETELLRRARAAGRRAVNGMGMLLYQGAKALELWTGRPAPIEVMRRALEQTLAGP